MTTPNSSITCLHCKKEVPIHKAKEHLDDLFTHALSMQKALFDRMSSEPIPVRTNTRTSRRRRVKRMRCDKCPSLLSDKDSLKRHAWTHCDWKRKCPECQAPHEFASAYILHLCVDRKRPSRDTEKTRAQFVQRTLDHAREASSTRETEAFNVIESTEAAGVIGKVNGSEGGVLYQEPPDTNNSRQSLWQTDYDDDVSCRIVFGDGYE